MEAVAWIFSLIGLIANLIAVAMFIFEMKKSHISEDPLDIFAKEHPKFKKELVEYYNEHLVICFKHGSMNSSVHKNLGKYFLYDFNQGMVQFPLTMEQYLHFVGSGMFREYKKN